jgi:hypothetical protein
VKDGTKQQYNYGDNDGQNHLFVLLLLIEANPSGHHHRFFLILAAILAFVDFLSLNGQVGKSGTDLKQHGNFGLGLSDKILQFGQCRL